MAVGPFGSGIDALVRHIGRKRDFAPRAPTPGVLSKTQWNDLRNEKIPLTDASLTTVTNVLAQFVGEAIDRRAKTGEDVQTAFRRIVSLDADPEHPAVDFLVLEGTQVFVDKARLKALYRGGESTLDPPQGGRVYIALGNAGVDAAQVRMAVRVRMPLEELERRVRRGGVGDEVRESELRAFLIEQIKRGSDIEVLREHCTEIVLRVSRDEAIRIHQGFENGELPAEVIAVRSEPVAPAAVSGTSQVPAPPTALSNRHVDDVFEAEWRAVVRRSHILRPWLRLRWLLSPHVAFAPAAHVIRESDDRCYALSPTGAQREVLKSDLVMSFVWWPAAAAVILLLVLTAAKMLDPSVAVSAGVVTGIVLSLTGAQVCACVVSPLAVGAGGVAMALMFGAAHAIVIGRFGSSCLFSSVNINRDFFTAVTGGLVGLSAPAWKENIPVAMSALILAGVGLAIAVVGWLMGQPRKAGSRSHVDPRREWQATFAGALVGAGIGAVFGITRAFEALGVAGITAFTAAFSVVGGLVFGLTVFIRTGNTVTTSVYALGHATVSAALCAFAARAAGTTLGLVALAGTTAWYHATWFTGAFIVAGRLGSERSAVRAAVIEGAGGFLAFALWRVAQG